MPDWFWDANVQSLLLSPFIGAVMGFVLPYVLPSFDKENKEAHNPASALNNILDIKAENSTVTIDGRTYVRDSFNTQTHRHTHRHYHNHGGSGTSDGNDAFAIAVGVLVVSVTVAAAVCQAYLRYANFAVQIIKFFSIFLFSFSLSYGVKS